jgi:hypothetical protein
MTQADRVLSTPPTNTSATNQPGPVDPTRRGFITLAAGASIISVGSLAAVAMPIAGALPSTAIPVADPIFAAIDMHRQADAACSAVPPGVDIPDELGGRLCAASKLVMRTRPTTPAGLAALTTWVRERADEMEAHSVLRGEDFCALTATIDDAARGMSGLKAWSPPDSPAVGQHPDTELFAATDRYLAGLSEYAACALAFGEIEFIKPRPRGYVSKERAYLRTMKHFGKMERELVNIRPKTLDGLIAKARAVEADRDVSDDLCASVLEDVLGMQPDRGKAVQS